MIFRKKTILLNVVKCYCALFTANTNYGPDANGNSFTTYDLDQDTYSGNCAQLIHGAWWFPNDCGYENPNGPYLTPGSSRSDSMSYVAFLDRWESLWTMKLMFR